MVTSPNEWLQMDAASNACEFGSTANIKKSKLGERQIRKRLQSRLGAMLNGIRKQICEPKKNTALPMLKKFESEIVKINAGSAKLIQNVSGREWLAGANEEMLDWSI